MQGITQGRLCMSDEYLFPNLDLYRANISDTQQAVLDYDSGLRYTYGDLAERSSRLAAFLLDVLGLQKGDRIAFCAPNSIAFIDAFYASCKTGVVITTYNFLLNPKELRQMVARETPMVFFYAPKYADTADSLRGENPSMHFIPLEGDPRPGNYCAYSSIMARPAGRTVAQSSLGMDDIQMLIHTGGTTGVPKAAMIPYRSLFYNSLSEVLTFSLSRQDTAYVFLPFFHTAAWNVLTLPLLLAGGRVIISSGFHPETALDIIETEGPTVAIAVETVYKAMAASPRFETADFSSYRWMLSGAAPISRATMECYWRKGVKLVNAYGMTEIGPSNLAPPVNDISLDMAREKWSSVGKPMFFNSLRVVDEHGNDVAEGEKGELIWRGNLTFAGYWQNEAATRDIYRDGWIYSGDIGYRDADGYYYICDRRKNMYISGGENIFPLEIQNAIQAHPQVESAYVLGVPDERWGEVGKALVVCKAGAALEESALLAYLAGEISRIKIPKYIVFVDAIPRNAVGKFDVAEIRRRFGAAE